MTCSLHGRIVEVLKNDKQSLSKALEIINSLQSSFTSMSKSENKKLILSESTQIGGKLEKIIINKDDYYYNIESTKPLSNKYPSNEIQLLTINDNIYGCGLILLDYETKEARIQTVSNYQECVYCSNSDITYKVGDIMMQIMIDICNKQKMKKITLEDNSKKKFTGNSVELIYFRTMTHGLPYYTKFNFRSSSYSKIIRDNKQHYESNPSFNKKIINEILTTKIDLKKNKTLQKVFEESLNFFKHNSVSVRDYMNYLFKLTEQEEKLLEIKREEYKVKKKTFDKINTHAFLIILILKDLYTKAGYIILPSDSFVRFLRN